MKEFRVKKELLNDEELRTNRISYKRLVNAYFEDKLLCNNINEIDNFIYDNIVVGELYQYEYSEYDCETIDIYQYYLCSLSEWDIESLNELQATYQSNDIIIAYSEVLDLHVLMVPHWGTSWDYVMTDIKPTIIGL
ncbi:MAG: hypothetical protein HFF36_02520 [Coprobacillus sp.]|nr:hypothetical protein [Coprobacillus sp.]